MDDEEKLIWMFNEVHGKMTCNCYTEFVYDENYKPICVQVMKDGNICWEATKSDLVFDYLTKHL